jgi:hypothetical protein
MRLKGAGLTSADLFMGRGFGEQDLKNKQTGADYDGAIGHIERRPLVLADVEEKEVNYVAADQAVPEVADCPTQD